MFIQQKMIKKTLEMLEIISFFELSIHQITLQKIMVSTKILSRTTVFNNTNIKKCFLNKKSVM